MKHSEILPELDWTRVDHKEGAVILVSKNKPLTLEIRANFHKEDDTTEITISTQGAETGGHTSYTGAPGSKTFNAVVDDLKDLAARRLAWELSRPGCTPPDDLDF
jgi:MoaA/NifB/PqqE/SkfB family radical SAM enzyme